jgi:2-polyprenyl-3-methyl-5-hydroxy-6-metoxy-1,4-benzoquinol methylase
MKILDVGCGPGIYVTALKHINIDATGIDLDRKNPYIKLDIFSKEFLEHTDYDLTMCIEVAEHIPEHLGDELIKRLCNTSATILFSAAKPGQGGHGHINCQSKDYWISKFNNNNFILDNTSTQHLVDYMKEGYHMGWFVQNVMVFKSYGEIYYNQIIEEETPQAVRLAKYLKNNRL